jgi:protein-S-isoprenylcysteine O-methyltransferase Ste14
VSPLAAVTVAVWASLEVCVRVREAVRGKGRRDRDRGTRVLLALSLGAAIYAAVAARSVQALRMSVPPPIAGVALMWLGLGLRVWAIAALGGSFRTTVEVDSGQPVVSTGPYRWIRHPSYLGLILIAAGFGVALGDWLSVVAAVLLPLPALAWRMHVEEAELIRVLGEPYRTYRSHTARLIPRVW